MTVIAFRPRSSNGSAPTLDAHPTVTGTFRSPRGRSGRMTGSVRVKRLVLVPRGAVVTGVLTGELRESDGGIIGVDSRHVTAPAELVQDEQGIHLWMRPFSLDLMGITVDVAGFDVDPALAFPRLDPASRRALAALPAPVIGPVA